MDENIAENEINETAPEEAEKTPGAVPGEDLAAGPDFLEEAATSPGSASVEDLAEGSGGNAADETADEKGSVPSKAKKKKRGKDTGEEESGEKEFASSAELIREMNYGTGIKAFWKKTMKERKYLFICFILPAMLMWLAYITRKVYPFGNNSVLVLDLNGQYVYFFEALRDIIHGGGSLLYSFRRTLGGEFIGIIGYYLASPFSIITSIFPDKFMTEALLAMFLLKIFSTMYALCAYAVVMQNNTMWIDNLIWLPMILLGIENLIKHGKFKLYVITLSLAIFSNFYIGYMMCIFVTLYFFYYYYSIPVSERNPRGVKYHLPKKLVQFGFFSLLAVAICAVMVWGSYYSLTFGKTEFQKVNFAFLQRFDFLDLASKMYSRSSFYQRKSASARRWRGLCSALCSFSASTEALSIFSGTVCRSRTG